VERRVTIVEDQTTLWGVYQKRLIADNFGKHFWGSLLCSFQW